MTTETLETITLKDNHAAIVVSPDNEIELFIPSKDGEANAPYLLSAMVVAIGALVDGDEAFTAIIDDLIEQAYTKCQSLQ